MSIDCFTSLYGRRFSNRKAFERVKRVIVEGNLEDGVLDMVIVVHSQKAFYLNGLEN